MSNSITTINNLEKGKLAKANLLEKAVSADLMERMTTAQAIICRKASNKKSYK